MLRMAKEIRYFLGSCSMMVGSALYSISNCSVPGYSDAHPRLHAFHLLQSHKTFTHVEWLLQAKACPQASSLQYQYKISSSIFFSLSTPTTTLSPSTSFALVAFFQKACHSFHALHSFSSKHEELLLRSRSGSWYCFCGRLRLRHVRWPELLWRDRVRVWL